MTILKSPSLKFVIGLLFIAFIVAFLSFSNIAQKSRPEFCKACHMMKPEFFSWKASSHEKVPCLSCHPLPDNINVLKNLFSSITNTYMAPIITITPIPDEKCETCHRITKRNVTPSGDLIIPHDSHKNKKIACAKCHRGVAHGHISQRKVTYKTDYSKWDLTLANALMTDEQTRTRMDTCMQCHKSRKAPLVCNACHRSSMLPENHKNNVFKYVNHGQKAAEDLKSCDKCHSYMSKEKYEGFVEVSAFKLFLESSDKNRKGSANKDSSKSDLMAARSYAKINTYCRDCHRQRPPSHGSNFTQHGKYAKINKDKCLTCHDNRKNGNSVIKISCGSCHPALHSKSFQWKNSHPIELTPGQKVDESCYQCHVRKRCANCHKTSPGQTKT